jgi:hypothetical protein
MGEEQRRIDGAQRIVDSDQRAEDQEQRREGGHVCSLHAGSFDEVSMRLKAFGNTLESLSSEITQYHGRHQEEINSIDEKLTSLHESQMKIWTTLCGDLQGMGTINRIIKLEKFQTDLEQMKVYEAMRDITDLRKAIEKMQETIMRVGWAVVLGVIGTIVVTLLK